MGVRFSPTPPACILQKSVTLLHMVKKTIKRSNLISKRLSIKKPNIKRPVFKKPSLKKPVLGVKHLLAATAVLAIGLFGFSGWYWYSNVLADPNRLLNDMVEKSIQTSSIERVISQDSQQSNVKQVLYTSFKPSLISESRSELKQVARVGEGSTVVTETIGTPSQDFIRYTKIDVPKSEKQQDFSGVLDAWGKREKNLQDEQDDTQVTFLNEALFSIVPFGDLNDVQRKALLAQVRETHPYTYDRAERKFQAGRPVMIYDMSLNTANLVGMLAKYVELTGVGDGSQLSPDQYKDAPPLRVQFTIDILSRHLTQINFQSTGRIEDYTAYGLRRTVQSPSQTIKLEELQERLQKLQ